MFISGKAALLLLTTSFTGSLAWGPSTALNPFTSTKITSFPNDSRLFMTTSSTESPPKKTINSNIVLRPTSDDPKAFDSLKIGNPRVHRYTRDSSVAKSDAEYVMWYHGRSTTFDEESDNSLPPLSTGRIGRAFSKNGLHWEKSTTEPLGASLAEDMEGVSLGLNTDSWWSFDTSHVGLGQVLLPMSNPAVITEGGVYSMYYMGGDLSETNVVDYMDSEKAPENMKDKKIKGMKMKIGVALSQDGKAWGRIEGDDPTGAIMVPYDKSDPCQQLNNEDSSASVWNVEEELYCAWPEVYVNLNAKRNEQAFTMYYSSMTKHGKEKVISRAVSEDGFRWFKRGICLRPGVNEGENDTYDPKLDAAGVARCNAFKNLEFDEAKGGWEQLPKKNSKWTMYYEGVSSEDNKHRILQAESDDGFTWTKKGILLDVGVGDEAWDCNGVGSPHILRMDDGSIRMYYTGVGKDGSTAIGVAKTNDDGIFEREQAQLTFV